jgi:hypothetical protein
VTTTVAVALTLGEPTRWGMEGPKQQRVNAGRGRGYRRPGRPCQTDVRLKLSGTEVVKDKVADP